MEDEDRNASAESPGQSRGALFRARVEAIAGNSLETMPIQITEGRAEWLRQIEAKEGYDDIIGSLRKGLEIP